MYACVRALRYKDEGAEGVTAGVATAANGLDSLGILTLPSKVAMPYYRLCAAAVNAGCHFVRLMINRRKRKEKLCVVVVDDVTTQTTNP